MRRRLQGVLPHPQQQDKDTVVFLDDAQAAGSEEEAEQRAAVVALHRVQVSPACQSAPPALPEPIVMHARLTRAPATLPMLPQGDRSLDRILPRPYVQQWKDLERTVGSGSRLGRGAGVPCAVRLCCGGAGYISLPPIPCYLLCST